MTTTAVHATHPKLAARLKRADGHLRSVIEMIGTGGPRSEIARQLQALGKAVANARRVLIHDHIDHRLDVEGSATDRSELKEIARYLRARPGSRSSLTGRTATSSWRRSSRSSARDSPPFIEAGEVSFACLQPGHYEAGMKGAVIVGDAL